MTEKERRGRQIFVDLPPEFNIGPFVRTDGLVSIDYEKLADRADGSMKMPEPGEVESKRYTWPVRLRRWLRGKK